MLRLYLVAPEVFVSWGCGLQQFRVAKSGLLPLVLTKSLEYCCVGVVGRSAYEAMLGLRSIEQCGGVVGRSV